MERIIVSKDIVIAAPYLSPYFIAKNLISELAVEEAMRKSYSSQNGQR